ncbi:MAG: ATP-binding protein [Planctomycetota bacterium]
MELTLHDGQAVLSVADTGIGIGEQAREHLFEEFYRSPEAKEKFPDGAGLGLAITKRIVTMHDGAIDVTPRPEGGTIFSVYLPALPGDRGAASRRAPVAPPPCVSHAPRRALRRNRPHAAGVT